MHRPSVMIGELDVWNRGREPLKSFLRHNTLPEPASRQESVPCTPSVTTLPSATAGELRGPTKPRSGPLTPAASYLSCQSSLPVPASRQRRISLLSWRAKTYSLSPTRAGVATPSPTVTFHFWVSSLGQVFGALNPVAWASRLGPRHCGQSCAVAVVVPSSSTLPSSKPLVAVAFLMRHSLWILGQPVASNSPHPAILLPYRPEDSPVAQTLQT